MRSLSQTVKPADRASWMLPRDGAEDAFRRQRAFGAPQVATGSVASIILALIPGVLEENL